MHARTRQRRLPARLTGALGVVVLGLLAACSPSEPAAPPEPAAGAPVEVFTWWASGSEKLALDALAAVFADQHPETRFVDASIAGGAGSAAKDLLESRLATGDPPDTFQVHLGGELRGHVAAQHLQPVDALVEELGLADVVPTAVLDLARVDGMLYAVPSNIHRANVLWSNPQVLELAGLDPLAELRTLDEWFLALEAVAQTDRTPLALGSTWTQVHLLEQVLLARLGAEAYAGLWTGDTDPASADVTQALTDVERLLGYANPDRDSLDWQDATYRVVDGAAGFTVMGDWAVVPFERAGGLAPEAMGWAPVPGTQGTFNLVIDAFALPADATSTEGARKWLSTVASAEGQSALSATKGAIPARTDVGPESMSTYQRDARAAFETDTLVPSLTHGTAADTETLEAVTAAMSRFSTGATDVAGLQAELVAAVG